jgi:hypothetical protein
VSDPEPNSTQFRIIPPGSSQVYWLSNQAPVVGTKYSSTYPGGAEKASCILGVPASYRAEWLLAGSQATLFRGGSSIWDGTLDEPVPSDNGWQVTAAGVGVQGGDFLATFTDTWPTSEPDELVNNAISRGLNWVNPGIGSPAGMWTSQPPDPGSSYVDDVLNLLCTRGGLGWFVNSQPSAVIGNDLSLGPLPTAPNRILVAVNPVARTNGGDVRAIYIRYQSSADNADASTAAVYSLTSVTNTGHTGREQFLDLSNAGTLTAAAAQAVATQILKIYQTSSFTGPFQFGPGQILTTGGVPVDPGMEQAGNVYRLILADFAFGGGLLPAGPIQCIGGGIEWDDDQLQGTLTPYQTMDQSLSGLLSLAGQSTTGAVTSS